MDYHAHSITPNLTLWLRDESYLGSRVRRDAKRTKKTQNRIREREAHTLRGRLLAAPFFHSDRFEESSRYGDPFAAAKQSLQRRRTVAGDPLSADSRSRTDRDNTSAASQWSLSILERALALPECYDSETISLASGAAGLAAVAATPRPVLAKDERGAAATAPIALRLGFHRADRLRKTRSRRCWLSPVQAGKKIVSSAALFRRTNERLLARRTASRSCLHWGRSARSAGRLFCQASHWRQTGYHSRRQGFLRPQDHCLAGAKKGSLCHGRQADSAHQAATLRLALSPSPGKRFDCAVLLSAIQMGSTLSVRSGATTPTGSTQRATDAVQVGSLLLSSVRHQSHVATTEPVALLQRPRGRGTDHSRTQRRLSLGQDPNALLPGQRNLFSSVAVGLQSGQLVQAAVSARRVPNRDAGDLTQPDLSDAGAIGSRRQPPSAGMPHSGQREQAWKFALHKIEKLRL